MKSLRKTRLWRWQQVPARPRLLQPHRPSYEQEPGFSIVGTGSQQVFARGSGCAVAVEKLLSSLKAVQFSDAESLIRFHDALLFLRAFPQSRKVIQLTETLLTGISKQLARLQESAADLHLLDSEQFSGIAGTTISDTFTYDVARWLVLRYPSQLSVDWDSMNRTADGCKPASFLSAARRERLAG